MLVTASRDRQCLTKPLSVAIHVASAWATGPGRITVRSTSGGIDARGEGVGGYTGFAGWRPFAAPPGRLRVAVATGAGSRRSAVEFGQIAAGDSTGGTRSSSTVRSASPDTMQSAPAWRARATSSHPWDRGSPPRQPGLRRPARQPVRDGGPTAHQHRASPRSSACRARRPVRPTGAATR